MSFSFISNFSKFFFFIIFILTYFQINSYLYFLFPTAIELKNKDILVIHKLGVTVCSQTFKQIKKNVYEFASEEQISSEEKLSKISIAKFDDGYIFSIIIDKLYIFDEEGNFKERTESLIPPGFKEELIFSLTSYIIQDGYYNFLIGYIYQQSLYLDLYHYHESEETIELERIAYLENYYEEDYYNVYKILNRGLSCEFLKYTSSTHFILCAYYTYNNYYGYHELSIVHFTTNGNKIQKQHDTSHSRLNNLLTNKIECIKSSITINRESTIFCLYSSDGKMFCIIYDLINNYNQFYYFEENCKQKYYGLKIDYYEYIEGFTVSCFAETSWVFYWRFEKL